MASTIRPLERDQNDEAIRMLARAFVTSPLHVATFGPGEVDRNATFFRIVLRLMKGPKLVAVEGAQIIGLIHWADLPDCRVSGPEKLRILPEILFRFGFGTTGKLLSWLSTWGAHDPGEPHCHLGPIAVMPELQGHGIGRQLMEQYCEKIDRSRTVGYLETDKTANVRFYERFGFETVTTANIHGVTNHFMRRSPR
jgi:ribosomal protein S18 acetylase RimI-like enzyme